MGVTEGDLISIDVCIDVILGNCSIFFVIRI